ncbi:MAG: hypothetical protein HY881_06735 [Deltaproteobacteria bacterium]|nr:hypothetical protein [Deltaproteobacteria bacterium]
MPGYDPEKLFFHDIRLFLFSACSLFSVPPDGMDRQRTFGNDILQAISHGTAAPVEAIPESPEITRLVSALSADGFV